MNKFCVSLLAAATSALALASAVESANTFGVLKVPTTSKNTVVCVPWTDLGAVDGKITVTNLVLASNMALGDYLLWWDSSSSSYKGWALTNPGASAYWSPASTDSLGATVGMADADTKLSRGGAIIVHQETPVDIYLYGQYSNQTASVAISEGNTTTPAYTLIAPTCATNVNLNALTWSGTLPTTADTIRTNSGTNYFWKTDGWYRTRRTGEYITLPNGVKVPQYEDTKEGVIIPAGQGVWYVSKGGSPTVSW